MAENTVLNPGVGGDTIAADEILGIKYQRVKLVEGNDGVNDGDVSASNPLPVAQTGALPAGANEIGRVRITDGTDLASVTAAGALVVDGSGSTQPVSAASLPLPSGAATAAGQLPNSHDVTIDNGALGAAVNIQDGGNSITVDGSISITGALPTGSNKIGAVDTDADATPASPVPATALYVAGTDGTNARGLKTDAAGELQIDVLTLPALPAGANEIGRVRITDGTDLASVTAAGRLEVDGSAVTQPVSAASLPLPAGAATAANQLPNSHDVTIDNATGAAAVNIQDGGNVITVDGADAHDAPVSANPVVSAGRASDAVPSAVSADGDVVRAWRDRRGAAKTVLVDDAGDSAMDGANNAVRVNVVAGAGGGGTSSTDEATYTPTVSVGTPIMGAADETAPDAAAEGTLAIVRATLNRALHVNLRDASGNEVSVGGGTQYAEDTVAAAAEQLTMAGVVRRDTASSLVDTDGDRTELIVDSAGRLHVNGSGVTQPISAASLPLPTGAATAAGQLPNSHDVTIDNASGASAVNIQDGGNSITVDQATAANLNAEVQGDAASDAPVSGNPVLQGGRASAAAPADVSADGDAVSAWYLRNGASAVVVTAAGALVGGDATNGLDVDVTRVPAPLSTTGGGTEATALRVTIANDSTGVVSVDDNGGTLTVDQATAANLNAEVQGDVAHDAAAAGNPILTAGISQDQDDTAPPNRVNAEGDATRLATDRDGALFVRPFGPQLWSYHENSSSALTDATVHAAPGAGLSLYVTTIVVSLGAATALNVFFEESTTTVLGPFYLEAVNGRGFVINFSTPKKITANTALTVTTSAAVAHSIEVTGYTAQG